MHFRSVAIAALYISYRNRTRRPFTAPRAAMEKPEPNIYDHMVAHYETKYRIAGACLLVKSETKIKLGSRDHRRCRFCGKSKPDVTFRQVTHALPEAIGNKSITIFYECDSCNQKFGAGIETEFGKWSKPLRTFYQ
jgi:hypothetical protein